MNNIEQIYFELADNLTETLLQSVGSKEMDGRTTMASWIKNNMPHCKEPLNEEELDELAEKEYPYGYTTSLYADEDCELTNDLREAFKAGYRKAN